ncbi:unnamed protein product [Closterium sp. NIES-54]
MYRLTKGDDYIILIVYVDDLLYIGSTDNVTAWFEGELQKDLTLTVSSTVMQYLGLNIKEEENAIYLNAAKYADTIAKHFSLTPTTISTPYRYMAGNNKEGSAPLKSADIRNYQRKLGCLLFAAVTCISLDESTDRVHGKHLILYATFFKRTYVVTEFLTLFTVDRADAASLTSAVVQYLTGIGVNLQKISSVASDGANVMVGKNKGVVTRLQMRIPHLASTHCIAHREALVANDAANAVPELGMIDNVVRAFAEHIGRSSVHYQKFHELQHIFCQTNLEAQGIHEVRWLSRGEAVQRLLDVLPVAIVVLKDYKKELYEVVTSFKFHWLIRFLADVLWELNALNKCFQQRQVDVTLVAHIVEQTRMHLKTRYSLRDPAHHFGSRDKMQLSEFIKRHQAMDKIEMKAKGADGDGNPVHFVYELHEHRLPGYKTDGDVTACAELLIKCVHAVDVELDGPAARAEPPYCPHHPTARRTAARATLLLPALLRAALLAGTLLPAPCCPRAALQAAAPLPAWPCPRRPAAARPAVHRPAGRRPAARAPPFWPPPCPALAARHSSLAVRRLSLPCALP